MLDRGNDVKNRCLGTDRADQRVIALGETDLLGAQLALTACHVPFDLSALPR
jgi:hypothetical protein